MDERANDASTGNGVIGIGLATDQSDGRQDSSRRRSRRRHVMMRLLAAGIGVGALTRLGTQTVQATNGDAVTAGNIVNATLPTGARNGVSYAADSTADGLQGYAQSANNSGVFGRNNDTSGIGVTGAAPSGTGVFGESINGYGVGARATDAAGYAVLANHTATSGAAIAVVATAASNAAGAAGVKGTTSDGSGVWGTSPAGFGVLGQSSTGAGVFGDSTSAGGYGVYGRSTSGVGVFGTTTSGYAGAFNGPVTVTGSFTVTGGPKSAAVPHPDGTHRRLYCVEAPESWFEDVGGGQLVSGRGQVTLDQDFAAVVRTDAYRVFVMPEGDCRGLFVANKTATGFEVRELQNGTSTIGFSYRIVAKRKDIAGPRLERVELPRPPAPGRFDPPTLTPTGPLPTPTPTPTWLPATPTSTPASSVTMTPPATSTPTPPASTTPTPSAPTPTPSTPSATPAPTSTAAPSATPSPGGSPPPSNSSNPPSLFSR
jgi:hypothetical protein